MVVAKGNPKNIKEFKDLTQPGLKVVLTDPLYSTTGYIVNSMAIKAGLKDKLEANVVTRTRGGGAAANAVSIGTADAAVVWNAVAHLRKDKLDAILFKSDARMQKDVDAVTTATFGRIDMDYIRVTMATLKNSAQLPEARKFADFVLADKNKAVWKEFGFSSADNTRPHPEENSSKK